MKPQNNFTTPEQSKRLLELGVPTDSADCYYLNVGHVSIRQGIERDSGFFSSNKIKYMPCWSVGRLIEILKCCITDKEELNDIFEELMMCFDMTKSLVQAFKEYSDVIDLNKLEK